MRIRTTHAAAWTACAILLLTAFSSAQNPVEPRRPKLVVVLVIDQFRADYLERFRARFSPDGFNRLVREGAYFVSCFYPYAQTETAPGHATLATGTTPDRHGIAFNSWYDAGRGRVIQAIEDDSSLAVGAASDLRGISPRNLVGTTLADELRLATAGEAKVFGVALKDRAAILSTGHTASGAYWYDFATGRFITSGYYTARLPDWVAEFNRRGPADRYYGKNWTINGRVAVDLTTKSGNPDAGFYQALRGTPYANELTLEFARELIEKEGLATGKATDFLFVGFSANDYVGHRWGPESEEVADITVHADALVAQLLQYLDQRAGRNNYWLVLSADHGVAPTLVQARSWKLPAKNIDSKAFTQAVERALAERWGPGPWLVPRATGTFNRETLAKYKVSLEEAARLAGKAAITVRGVQGYVSLSSYRAADETARAYRLSLFAGRGPDVLLVPEPFALADGERGGTTHGTPYSYDTHVPLILFGPAFRPGVYAQRVSPTDLAPTLAAALRINPPTLASGRVVSEALAYVATQPASAPVTVH